MNGDVIKKVNSPDGPKDLKNALATLRAATMINEETIGAINILWQSKDIQNGWCVKWLRVFMHLCLFP